nr:hypothetical protein [Tanacetum cinerariifolium]
MTTTAPQQVALDNALVPHEKRVKINKCNMRIDPTKTQKEPTYQVVLDALALDHNFLAMVYVIICTNHRAELVRGDLSLNFDY